MKKNNIPPTQLFIGTPELVRSEIIKQLQQLFCNKNGVIACTCVPCKQIRARQHYAVRWYAPEKQMYTLAEIEPLFEEIRFKLEEGTFFVHVIEHADLLSIACANSLLKVLEEPSEGYHFILATQYPSLILPTIYSRCVVKSFSVGDVVSEAQRFLGFFKNPSKDTLFECMKEFDKSKITERDTRILIDELIQFWLTHSTSAVQKNDSSGAHKAQRYAECCVEALKNLPMPGSAKLFWRTLYAQMLFK